jgi:hypothetical protein
MRSIYPPRVEGRQPHPHPQMQMQMQMQRCSSNVVIAVAENGR